MTVLEFPHSRDAELRRYAFHAVPVIEIVSRMHLPEAVIRKRLAELKLLALYRKRPYKQDETKRMLDLHDGGLGREAIARVLQRDEQSVGAKLSHELTIRKQERESQEARKPAMFENIVDQAKHILRKAGYTQREIDCMTLDAIMREANRRLHLWAMPQLGKKREWLWP
jgi:spore germination cell wall hydrolase CwlJ-like protein